MSKSTPSENKPRQRVPAGSSATTTATTHDGFVNFAAKIGVGAANLQSASTYNFRLLSRNRTLLEAMYRGSWICGAAVDHAAEDMTKGGITLTGNKLSQDDKDNLHATIRDLGVWQSLQEALKWSRLYGGSLAVICIDGQDASTPLNLDSVGQGQFKGLMVLDRWLVLPSMNDLIDTPGPLFGFPKFYEVVKSPGLPAMKIHYSRALRFTGQKLPYWQSLYEQRWGASVLERLYDRLLAFDSTTQGAAQLVFKAHLRTLKLENLRELIAAGGPLLEAVTKQLDLIRQYQSIEGLTLLDAKDEFQVDSYTFSGLDDVLARMGEQIAGAIEEPLVRLFGQSPAGFSNGESDLRNYYDTVNKRQEADLRAPLTRLLDVTSRSTLGKPAGATFSFTFNDLWKVTAKERAEAGNQLTSAVSGAFSTGLVRRDTALKTLRGTAEATGLWGDITDEEIKEAEDEPPPTPEGMDPAAEEDETGGSKPGLRLAASNGDQ